MIEMVYRDRLYIAGKAWEIRKRLSEHAITFKTVKELLDRMAPYS